MLGLSEGRMLRNKYLKYMLFALSVSLMGCPEEGTVTEGSTTGDFIAPPPAEDTVCEPFDGETLPGAAHHGVKGILYYRGINDPPFTSVDDYFANGVLLPDALLYLNQLHIPTRPFDRGFVTQAGEPLQTPEGDMLYEWFAVHFSGRLTLAPDQPEGLYEFSLLADDGAIMRVDDGSGNMQILVNNDGTHSTRMGCTSAAVYLDHQNPVPFVVDYNQGPRYHIALVVLMRPYGSPTDPSCGTQGNSLFFDSTQDPPVPKPAYDAILSRGWTPVAPANYLLPEESETNPCNQVAPIITNVAAGAINQTSVTVSWVTDIFATSQVQITNAANGNIITTPIDTNYVQLHSKKVTGLTPNTLYRVRAISQSSSGLSTQSVEILFRTLR